MFPVLPVCLDRDIFTYANEAKQNMIGVKGETLIRYGAVSEQTAREMSEGAACTAGCDCALSVTGIAGPTGGTKEKPVGLVYIGCTYRGKTSVKELHFSGNRGKIREQTVVTALAFLRESILNSL